MPQNLVEHAVITDPNPVGVLGGSQLLVAVWKWIPSKGFDGPDDFYDLTRGNFSKIFSGGFTPGYREANHPVLARQRSLGD